MNLSQSFTRGCDQEAAHLDSEGSSSSSMCSLDLFHGSPLLLFGKVDGALVARLLMQMIRLRVL
jgi:hypothetical protein